MQLIPVSFPLVKEGDDIASLIVEHADLCDGDIIAVSSKILATAEGASIDLGAVEPSPEAEQWVDRLNRKHPDPSFRQAVLDETTRLHGVVLEGCSEAMLCDVRPSGIQHGSILCANAGLDRSNSAEGSAIGWPKDSAASTKKLHAELQKQAGVQLGVLCTDSCCRPRRQGLTAIALTVAGFDPIVSHIGKHDLFEKPLAMTQEAIADQLATAANFLMGNGSERIPVVVIRDHGIQPSDYCGWVDGIEHEEDLFKGL